MGQTLLQPEILRRLPAADRLVQARRLVEEELRQVAVGQRIPSMRVLRARSRVGLAQLRQIMSDLEEEGAIERRARSGLYRAGASGGMRAVHTLDLVACGRLTDIGQQKQSFTADLVRALAAEAGRHDLAIRLRQVYAQESASRYEAIAADGSVGGCLLLAPHLPEIAGIFERRGVKTVSVVPREPQGAGPAILDAPNMVATQLNHLWELGHRRIAYMDGVNPQAPGRVLLQRREDFYRLMNQRGVAVAAAWVFPMPPGPTEDFDPAIARTALERVFAGPARPTALIVTDQFASHVYRFAAGRGWQIGRDLSVVGTDDIAVASQLDPPLTTVHNDRKQAAARAIATLQDRLAGRDVASTQFLALDLVVRGSTGPAIEAV